MASIPIFRAELRDTTFGIGHLLAKYGTSGEITPASTPGAIVYKRHVVSEVGGWNEMPRAAQDRDFFTSVVSGARIGYQPSSCCISGLLPRLWAEWRGNGCLVQSRSMGGSTSVEKSEAALARADPLTDEYRAALALAYFEIVRHLHERPPYAIYAKMLVGLIHETLVLCPSFHVADEPRLFRTPERLFGFKFAVNLLWIHLPARRRNTFLRVCF